MSNASSAQSYLGCRVAARTRSGARQYDPRRESRPHDNGVAASAAGRTRPRQKRWSSPDSWSPSRAAPRTSPPRRPRWPRTYTSRRDRGGFPAQSDGRPRSWHGSLPKPPAASSASGSVPRCVRTSSGATGPPSSTRPAPHKDYVLAVHASFAGFGGETLAHDGEFYKMNLLPRSGRPGSSPSKTPR